MKYISILLLVIPSIFTLGNPSRLGVPEELEATLFSSRELTPCVACLSVAPTGEVYAGIDQIGSLGKGAGFGRILRLIDKNNDGVSDGHTVYAEIDNPRGLISVGDKLYVLHTRWGDEKKFEGQGWRRKSGWSA